MAREVREPERGQGHGRSSQPFSPSVPTSDPGQRPRPPLPSHRRAPGRRTWPQGRWSARSWVAPRPQDRPTPHRLTSSTAEAAPSHRPARSGWRVEPRWRIVASIALLNESPSTFCRSRYARPAVVARLIGLTSTAVSSLPMRSQPAVRVPPWTEWVAQAEIADSDGGPRSRVRIRLDAGGGTCRPPSVHGW